MHPLVNFLLGSFNSYGLFTILSSPSIFANPALDEVIRIIVALVGGILSALIISILKARYPKIFSPRSKNVNRKETE